ncbi:MAG: nucleotidyltransferase family protein [Chromatiaceae bacterium]
MNGSAVSAVLLAAGESRRMGTMNKLFLDIAGMPLLRRAALTLLGASAKEVVVVVGHEAALSQSLLSDLPLRVVENPHFADGQMTSVYCGLHALQEPCEGVMVCLADQPLLDATDLETLALGFVDGCSRSVLVPTYRGRRGNPVILPSRVREAILAGGPDLGGERPIDTYRDLVRPLEMPNDHCVFDLDTPEDWVRVRQRLGPTPPTPRGEAVSEAG